MFSNSPLLLSNKIQRYEMILTVLMITLCLMIKNAEAGRDRPRCEKPDYIPNGSYRMRRDRVMRIMCKPGFQLQGPKTIECIRGKWDGEKPVCAKKGCKNDLIEPKNGRIQIESDVKAILYCSENYNLAGNRHSYCNGTHWDRPIGNCREHKNVVQHTCDFETDDICGWTYEQREGLEWKRVMAANVFTSFKTGPRHDHTTMKANGGHYMLMESLTPLDVPVILTSPIYDRSLSLKTACCFQFYYFMYGAGVGDLFVVVKPVSLSLDEIFQKRKEFIKFEKNGNQNNIWNEAHFNIEELEEDFQILFVAKAGQGQLSDIAVDDVKLLTGDSCKIFFDKKDDEDSSNEEYDSTTYESIFEMQSCEGRCFDGQGVGLIKHSGHLKGLCSCEIDCEDNDTCCPDYRTVCLKELFSDYMGITYTGEEITKQSEELLKSTTTSTTTATPIRTTISTTPSTVKTTPTTPSTTSTTTTATMKTTTKIITTPTTLKTTPTTRITPTTITKKIVKTTPTTVRTTPISTTIKPKSTQTTTISTSTKKTTPSTTTTHETTTASPTTTPSRTTTTTTLKPIVDNKISQVTTPIPDQKPMEYIINDKPNAEIPHRGSNFLLWVFIVIALCILAAVVCRRFGSKVADWYKIQFKPNASGDEDSTSIITSYKGSTSNGSTISQKTRKCVNKKTKKSSPGNSSMATPLIDDIDDDDDDMAINGNIALKNHIYTEL